MLFMVDPSHPPEVGQTHPLLKSQKGEVPSV